MCIMSIFLAKFFSICDTSPNTHFPRVITFFEQSSNAISHNIDPLDGRPEVRTSDRDDIHNSFQSLRRLIGMDDDEHHHHDNYNNNNNDMISCASHPDDVVVRPPSVTFSSLRKLLDGGTSFCLPSAEKMRRSCSKSISNNNNNNNGNHHTPRDVYDDSETDDDGNDKVECSDVRSSSLLVPDSSSSIRRPTPSSFTSSTATPTDANFSSPTTTTPDPSLFHNPQDFFTTLLRKTPTSTPANMNSPNGGIPFRGIPVSPVPFPSDRAIVEHDNKQRYVVEKAVSRSIFTELEEQHDNNVYHNTNEMVVARDNDLNSDILRTHPVDGITIREGKIKHEVSHNYSLIVRVMLVTASIFSMMLVGEFLIRKNQMYLLNTSARHVKKTSPGIAFIQTMVVVTEKVVEEAEPIIQNMDALEEDLAPVSNDEISNEAETGGETNVPAIQNGEVLEPHDVAEELVAPESAIQDGEILVPQDVAEELALPSQASKELQWFKPIRWSTNQ
jgi:hypothetical protein